MLDGLNENRSLIEMDIRETQCGDSNTRDIRLKLNDNRRIHKKCRAAGDDDDKDSEEEEEEDDDEEEEEEEDATDTSFSSINLSKYGSKHHHH